MRIIHNVMQGGAIMRKGWILALLPLALEAENGLFDVAPIAEESPHFVQEEADFEDMNQGLTLLEMDERDPLLLPWDPDELIAGEYREALKKKSVEKSEEVEDVFTYELSGQIEPTYEKISEEKKRLFQPPKVVHTKKD